jgi:RNA polymerase sigma-70 factor (sigma-E family)
MPMATVRSGAEEVSGARAPGAALESLYRDTHRSLVRLATLLLSDQQRAEDVVQDVFVDLFERWGRLRSQQSLEGYVRTAVAHAAVSAHRHRRVAERHRPDPVGPVDSAEVTALSRLRRSEIIGALDALPQRQRQVVVLRYYGGLSEADIARALGVSRGAVKSHCSRALRNLRPVLEAVT